MFGYRIEVYAKVWDVALLVKLKSVAKFFMGVDANGTECFALFKTSIMKSTERPV